MLEIKLMGFQLSTFLIILIFDISKICCDSTIGNSINVTTNDNINASSSSIITQTDDPLTNAHSNDSVNWTKEHKQLADRQFVRHFMTTESLIKTNRKNNENRLKTMLTDSGQSAFSRTKRIKPEPSRKECVQSMLDDNLGTHLSANEPNVTNFLINAPKIELAHKLFDTHHGLVEGISYTAHISLPISESITDICVVCTSDNSYIGMFESKSRQSRLQSSISESKQATDDCVQKVWCTKPTAADANNMLAQWSFTKTDSIQRKIVFRTFYKPRSTQIVFETTATYTQPNACELYIKGINGIIDQTMLPAKIHDECTIIFPTRDYPITSESPGLLIEIKRLNVPCDSNGYVQIANRKKMCGKFEDIPSNNRISYIPLQRNTTIFVIKSPTFELQYEFVDYCHNITLSSRNDSTLIRPKQKMKCYYRVHVPYGNRIELRLIRNVSDESSLTQANHQNYDIDLEQESDYTIESTLCSGMEIIVEDLVSTNKWQYCSTNTENRSKAFTFLSSSNSMAIRLSSLDEFNEKMVINEMPILLEYFSISIPQIVSECPFGWIKTNQFCVSVSSIKLPWEQSESFCRNLGGHLASIKSEKEQECIDNLLKNSLYAEESNSFWIGASDHIYEGDFRWTDGFPYTYSNWFVGWPNYNNYNKQPNDDGLSEQDCVELRRNFEVPFKLRQSTGTSMTSSLYKWNDRGCEEENFFLCERPIADELIKQPWINDCNRTIIFTRHYSRDYIWSPGYPKSYPDRTNCFTVIIAPKDYYVVIEFEAFLLENEPQCSYDYLELIDSPHYYINRTNTNVELMEPNLYNDNDGSHNRSYIFEVFLEIYKNHQNYSILTPFTENTDINKMDSHLPQRICGNWNSKLKLLRYRSQGPILGLHFSSDYSHHFAGYKAKISIKSALSQCSDDRLKPFNGMCYLFATYPELNWYTARKVCSSMNADLTSINSIEEQTFIISNIRNDLNFSPQTIYWLGGKYDFGGHTPRFGWSDGKNVTYQGWLQDQSAKAEDSKEKSCLSLQWKTSANSMLPSGLFETFDSCVKSGGYICKMNNSSYNGVMALNRTFAGYEGTIQSPNFPNLYPTNLDLRINLIGPANTRLVIHFDKIDLEEQQECLYDYVSIRDDIRLMGTNELLTNARIRESRSDNVLRPFKNVEITQTSNTNATNSDYPTFWPYLRVCSRHETKMFRFDFMSKINRVRIEFHSDYSVSRTGFSLKWRAISMDACPSKTYNVNEQFTTITSPNFPNFLLNNLNCTYVLSARAKHRIWIEFHEFHFVNEANIAIDLGHGFFVPFKNKKHLNDGVFVSYRDRVMIHLTTGNSPIGSGFKFSFKLITEREEHSLILSSGANGVLRHLNHPQSLPHNVEFTQHFIAPLGEVISLEFYNVNLCETASDIEVYDNYADVNGSFWNLCEISPFEMHISNETEMLAPKSIRILSYLNTIHIRQKRIGTSPLKLNATIRIQPDLNYKYKLASGGDEVESCRPNPCRNGGRCESNGVSNRCRCIGHYVGRFCALTMCEVQPCMFGSCELSPTSFKCNCLHGYRGRICDSKEKPCDENPCENRGVCLEKNGRFVCRCHAWWEGTKCEHKITHIPYKPLSKRMLKEPFWLGLITVCVVLSLIGFVWCAKRHFPDKIEKLLVENSDSNRLQGSQRLHTHYHPSLREQLNFTTTNSAPQSTATTPGAARLFGKMGLRKPSILSLSSTQVHAENARTASLDDLMRSPTQRTSCSARKTRKNAASIKTKTSTEKRLIIETLIAPATINTNARTESTNNLNSTKLPLLLQTELSSRPSSVPPTPNESRSLRRNSSNRGSNSYSGSELTMNELFVNRRMKSKFSSADSILTMLRNFTSMNVISQLPSSLIISPSTTPSASSQHDESPPWRDYDNVSLSSSMNTPLSQCASETSVPYSMPSISIDDTMDSANSYKSSSTTSINSTMNPTTILLEVPTNANKCLSPIRELPTPVPSPALTPIMSRSIPHRFTGYTQSLFIDKSFPKNEESAATTARVTPKIDLDVAGDFKTKDDQNGSAQNKADGGKSFADNNPDRSPKSPSRPTNLVIPQLIVQQSSPTKDCIPFFVHGSPPPKRSNIGDVHIFVTSATPDVNDDKLRAFELIMAEESSSIAVDPLISKKKE